MLCPIRPLIPLETNQPPPITTICPMPPLTRCLLLVTSIQQTHLPPISTDLIPLCRRLSLTGWHHTCLGDEPVPRYYAKPLSSSLTHRPGSRGHIWTSCGPSATSPDLWSSLIWGNSAWQQIPLPSRPSLPEPNIPTGLTNG